MKEKRQIEIRRLRRLVVCLSLPLLMSGLCGCPGGGATRVEYYRHFELEYGWRPVGYGRIPDEDVDKIVLPAPYKFVYRDGKLSAVYEACPGGDQLVYGEALVLRPEVSPYGAGPFVIGPTADAPRYGMNFVTGDEDMRYHAQIDADGKLSKYRVTLKRPDGTYQSAHFKCTYEKHGLLSRLEVVGVNELADVFDFERKEYAYNEDGGLVFEVQYTPKNLAVARVYLYDEHGLSRTVVAMRLRNGKYRVRSADFPTGHDTGFVILDELPPEFHDYIEELPRPER